jgi:hypothetical protein
MARESSPRARIVQAARLLGVALRGEVGLELIDRRQSE